MKRHPIVILHGWNLSAARFAPLCATLRARGYTVFCEDLPGFGNSPLPPHPLTLDDYIDHVTEFLRHKKITDPILIGHSFGGRIAIKLAAQQRVSLAAVILSGAPGFPPVPPTTVRFYRALARMGTTVTSWMGMDTLQDTLRMLLYRCIRSSDYIKTSPHMRETFKRIVGESLEGYLPKMTQPTLLIWGQEDRIVPVAIAEKMQQVIPQSRLIRISGARHGVPWTHPEQFSNAVDSFLSTHS